MLYALRSSPTILVIRIIEWWLPVRENCRPAYFRSYEAKSLQLALTACYLAYTVLNIWSYLRHPGDCYPVTDLPCRDGNHTRWNNRPCSAALPLAARDMGRELLAETVTRKAGFCYSAHRFAAPALP